MSKKKEKYYTVWQGRKTGVFDSWEECEKQIKGFQDAQYKSFPSKEMAKQAFLGSYEDYKGKDPRVLAYSGVEKELYGMPIEDSVAVDAAYSSATGKMEYQGVYTKTKERLFYNGPFEDATINAGEFLAIVHALAMLQKKNSNIPVYSDSTIAISWVKNKKAKTKLKRTEKNAYLFELIGRAEKWLHENAYSNPLLKWETRFWGEIPADFGRK